ncbi:hypothetical protein GCM10010921_26660 [Microbacterium album]|uniref:Uncharacterized protein n=1 Tax=Microbacterium album TaxID=2053191 RepID=A0A917IFQ4_9MICO|nr:hypothetical protein GCM10010921_26660 [Microbacterium album]
MPGYAREGAVRQGLSPPAEDRGGRAEPAGAAREPRRLPASRQRVWTRTAENGSLRGGLRVKISTTLETPALSAPATTI